MAYLVDQYLNHDQRKSNDLLLKLRIWFSSSSLLFSVTLAILVLQIDFAGSDNRLVQQYHRNRWLLMTTWFNVLSMMYTPICIYCDWRELQRTENVKHVKLLNQIRFVCFSSILYPVTMFGDVLFWKLWTTNRDLVAPRVIDELVPSWVHHGLHSVSLVMIILDLLMVPRRRPKNLMFGAGLLALFLSTYISVCARSIIIDEPIYPLLKMFSGFKLIPLLVFTCATHFLFFISQWFVVDFVWGPKTKLHDILSLAFIPKRFKIDVKQAKRINN